MQPNTDELLVPFEGRPRSPSACVGTDSLKRKTLPVDDDHALLITHAVFIERVVTLASRTKTYPGSRTRRQGACKLSRLACTDSIGTVTQRRSYQRPSHW